MPKMPKYILNWKQLLGYTVILGLLTGFQGIAMTIKHNYSNVYEGNCKVINDNWEGDSVVVQMSLNCGGRQAWSTSSTLIVSYLNNPGELKCKVFEDDEAECESRPGTVKDKPPGVPRAKFTRQPEKE